MSYEHTMYSSHNHVWLCYTHSFLVILFFSELELICLHNNIDIMSIYDCNYSYFHGTVTSPLMDYSKSYINREPITLIGWDEWSVVLQYILSLIPCSELSFPGPKLGPHQLSYMILYYSIFIICLHTVKWLQLLLCNTNYSIQLN